MSFLESNVLHLGFECSIAGISPMAEKPEAIIKERPSPKCSQNVQAMFLCEWCSNFSKFRHKMMIEFA